MIEIVGSRINYSIGARLISEPSAASIANYLQRDVTTSHQRRSINFETEIPQDSSLAKGHLITPTETIRDNGKSTI